VCEYREDRKHYRALFLAPGKVSGEGGGGRGVGDQGGAQRGEKTRRRVNGGGGLEE